MSERTLGGRCRDTELGQVRELVMLVGVERNGLRCRELAVALGQSADQISRWAGLASRRKGHDGEFQG